MIPAQYFAENTDKLLPEVVAAFPSSDDVVVGKVYIKSDYSEVRIVTSVDADDDNALTFASFAPKSLYYAATESIPTASSEAVPIAVGQLIVDDEADKLYVVTAVNASTGAITKQEMCSWAA